MAAGRARVLRGDVLLPVAVVKEPGGLRQWSEVWRDNPDMAQPDYTGPVQELIDGSGRRQYIAAKGPTRWTWREFMPTPARLVLTIAERNYAHRFTPRGAVLIEPTIKPRASPNKQWPRQHWQRLVLALPDIAWVQVGPPQGRAHALRGAHYIETPTFRHACAVLAECRAAVLHEGGLHHAAAALGVRAVVIYGGFITPAQTGYALHTNLVSDLPGTPCGMRVRCPHCDNAMARITPAQVAEALKKLL